MEKNIKELKVSKKEIHSYKLKVYDGSLDFDCDFCNENSYYNLHIEKDSTLIVICFECLTNFLVVNKIIKLGGYNFDGIRRNVDSNTID